MSALRPSGLHINKPAIFGIIALFVLIILVYKYVWTSGALSVHTSGLQAALGSHEAHHKMVVDGLKSSDKVGGAASEHPMTWNLSQLQNPPVLNDEAKKKLARKSEMFEVDVSGTKIKVYVRQVINNDLKAIGDILFLHGAKFSSQNWEEIGALDQVANWGFRAIAVDLPGKGKSTQALDFPLVPKFVPALIKTLEMTRPVIIAPSMSGQYAIPYLFTEPEKGLEKSAGFVPIAPVGTSPFVADYAKSQLPTLIVYGSDDPSAPRILQDLRELPKGIVAKVEGAGHACYMDKPDSFFKFLHGFLKQLKT